MSRLVKVRQRRKREGKTDYGSRLNLLKGKIPRAVVRKTNKYILAQIVESKEARDFTKIYVVSKILEKYGWHFSFKNLPAAYLTGLILGKKALKIKIKKLILDIGIFDSTRGSKIYALVKGLKDSGIEINCDEKMLPNPDRISGKHIQKNAGEINRLFEQIKNKILKE